MGQIIGGAAKPKRCNLNQLSQVPTPAAGEHILVSSDNSMNAAGQGNFDCYIVGNGTKAATELERHPIGTEKKISNTYSNSYSNSGGINYPYTLKAGSTYAITNTGSNYSIRVFSHNGSSVVETFATLAAGNTIEFTPSVDGVYLRIYYDGAGSFYIEEKNTIDDRLNTIEGEIIPLENGLESAKNDIDSLEDNTLIDENLPVEINTGGISSETGEIVSHSNLRYIIVDLTNESFAKLVFETSAFSSPYGYGFFLSDNSWVGVQTTSTTTIEVDVPSNAVEFRTCFNTAHYTSITITAKKVLTAAEIYESLGTKVSEDELKALEVTDDLIGEAKSGYMVNSDNGNLIVRSDMDYIVIDLANNHYLKLKFYTSAYTSNRGYGFFLSDNSWVGVHTTSTEEIEVEVPSNAVEFRTCWNPSVVTDQHIYAYGYGDIEKIRESIKSADKNRLIYPFHPSWDDLSHVPSQNVVEYQTLASYYNEWDSFVANYPDWVTKVDCSEAETDLGITAPSYLEGYPIYMYKFIPKRCGSNSQNTMSRLKIMLVAGVHSNEKLGMFLLINFFKMLAENFSSDGTARQLRTMVDFYVIPCLNSWGYDSTPVSGVAIRGRQNGNGVNLNRNFPTKDWVASGSPTDSGGNYTGASAGSEYETKICMYYANQINPDSFFDLHAGGMNTQGAYGSVQIHESVSEEIFSMLVGMSRNIINRWMLDNSNFPSNPDTAAVIFQADRTSLNGECCRWFYENITPLSILTEESIIQNWVNGVLQPTQQEYNTARIWRENLQSIYNTIMCIVEAASVKLFKSE